MTVRGRGAGWVALQMALLGATGAAGFRGPRWPRAGRRARRRAGLALLGGGAALAVWGARALGPALTPLPAPRPGTALRDAGPYRVVRHPIYTGLVAGALGAALLRRPLALVPAVALGPVLLAKSRREEAYLLDAVPGYADYRSRVPWRMVPFA